MSEFQALHGDKDASEERLRLAVESTDTFGWELELATNQVKWSPNAARVIGCQQSQIPSDMNDGLFFVRLEDRARIAAEYQRAVAGTAENFETSFRGLAGDVQHEFWRVRGRIVRNKGGATTHIIALTRNITRETNSENALRLVAERLTTAEEAAAVLIYDWDIAAGSVWWSAGLTRVLGWKPEDIDPSITKWADMLHPADPQRVKATPYDGIIQDNDRFVLEYRMRHKLGHYVWLLDSGQVYRNRVGKIIRVAGGRVDITARKKVEASQNYLADLLRLSFEPIFVWHPERGIKEWNRGAENLYGYSRGEAIGKSSHDLLQTLKSPRIEEVNDVLKIGWSWTGELEQRAKDGRRIIVESRLQAIMVDDDILILETNHDVTDRKEWEARQRLMNRELVHRNKNSFAILQGILRSTLRTSRNPQDFAEAFSGRLHSMAAAQDILTASNWRGAELGALVRHQLSVYVPLSENRIDVAGPELNIPAEYATPFGLIFNELATNALKHGALSTPTGNIQVFWRTERPTRDQITIFITWRERGGPPVVVPLSRGFGSTLIEKSLPEAKIETIYEPEGLTCKIELSLKTPKRFYARSKTTVNQTIANKTAHS